jgi:hypothetical protein
MAYEADPQAEAAPTIEEALAGGAKARLKPRSAVLTASVNTNPRDRRLAWSPDSRWLVLAHNYPGRSIYFTEVDDDGVDLMSVSHFH